MAFSFVGCASVQSPVSGAWYTGTDGGVAASSLPIGSSKGEACATSILGLIATGDASIRTAAGNAGITRISTVDHTDFAVLGLYAKYCTVVYGYKGKGAARAKKAAPKAAAPAASDSSGSEDEDF